MTDKKYALVTGANGGIGLAIVDALVADGIYVLATCRKDSDFEALNKRLGDKGEAKKLDITDFDRAEELFAELEKEGKSPSILVNNAGITADNLLIRLTEETWDKVINTNLKSAFMLTQLAVKAMSKAQWGRIINISSIIARLGNRGQANYAAAKAGLEGLTRVSAAEFARKNICINAIAPGFIATPMTSGLNDEIKAKLTAQVPMGRFGEPEEIGAMVAFLASEKAGYITGQSFHINGGMLMV